MRIWLTCSDFTWEMGEISRLILANQYWKSKFICCNVLEDNIICTADSQLL